MRLRFSHHIRPMMAILAATIALVALACGGDEATPTSAPTATSPAPTATTPAMVEPTATSPAMVEATTAPGEPTATSPAMVEATATEVPEVMLDVDYRDDWMNFLMDHRGYKPEWGEPQYGGIYKTADPRPATRYQSGLGYGAFSRWQFAAHNSLMMMDPWGEITDAPMCDVCESFEISADGLTYTFVLRDNVQFHSEGWVMDQGAPGYGTELSCEDVKASMEWFANPPPETRASTIKSGQFYMGHLQAVACPDGPAGKTTVLNFDRVRNGTLGWLAAGIAIWDKEYREWMDAEYPGVQSSAVPEGYLVNMGTGPFIVESADSQTVMKSRKNPNYWLEGAPFVDGMDNFAIQDYNTKFAALVTGKIHQAGHGSSGVTKAQVQQIQDTYGDIIEQQIVRYNHQQHFLMNHLRPPFDDRNVRWAVQLALDREDWLEFTTVGDVNMGDPYYILHSDAGWGTPVEEFQKLPGLNPATKDADLAEANRILDEVFGPGNRPKTDQYVTQLLSRREVSLWGFDFFTKNLNWDFNVKYVDTYGTIQTDCLYTIRSEASPTYGQSYISHAIDGLWKVHSEWHTRENCRDDPGWTGNGPIPAEEWAKLDALLEELDVTQDRARGEELVKQVETHLYESAVHTPLGIMNVAWPNRRDAKGIRYYNLGTYSQQRLTDRVWLTE